MAVHKLFLGGMGNATFTLGQNMFPSVDLPPFREVGPAYEKTLTQAAITRTFDFGCGPSPTCTDCSGAKGQLDLQAYARDHVFAVGDVIEAAELPMNTILTGVFWKLDGASPGVTVQLRIRGLAGTSVPASVDLGAVIDFATVGGSYIHLATPLYLDHNDMLEFVLVTLPPAPVGQCTPCESLPLASAVFTVSPIVTHFRVGGH
jgi:hypothetical protein